MTMRDETIRRIARSEKRLDAQTMPELTPDLISPFLALPGLRGFWPMSAIGAIGPGEAFDQSPNGRTLTRNGDPEYNYDGLAPYIDLDGTGDWLSRVDEAGLDILGTETYVAAAARGMSVYGWWWFNNVAAAIETCGSKWIAGTNNRSWRLTRLATGALQAQISVDGTAVTTIASATIVGAGVWVFGAMVYDPSAELSVFTGLNNLTKSTLVAAIPASIFNSNADFRIGANGTGGERLTGRASVVALCVEFHSDAIVSNLYQDTRGGFGA